MNPSWVERAVPLLMALTAAGGLSFLISQSTFGIVDRTGKVRGRDFLQFYLAGRLVHEGRSQDLYEPGRFFETQQAIAPVDEVNPRYYPLYPPTVGLAFSSMASLRYERAVELWWLIQFVCLAISAQLLAALAGFSPNERRWTWLLIASFYPVWSAILNGQLAPVLLLLFSIGLTYQLDAGPRGSVRSGLILSLLAIKPQFGASVALWLLLRRDGRTALGFWVGVAAQFALVGLVLGFATWLDYARNLRLLAMLSSLYQFTPDYEHSMGGIVRNLLGAGWSAQGRWLHLLLAAAALIAMSRIVRPVPAGSGERMRPCDSDGRIALELAAAPLFFLVLTPHLLVYDLSLLLASAALLHRAAQMDSARGARSRWLRLALAILAAAQAAPLYAWTGFSLVPLVLVVALWRIAAAPSRAAEKFANDGQQVIGGIRLGK